jgi:hypothetical protein
MPPPRPGGAAECPSHAPCCTHPVRRFPRARVPRPSRMAIPAPPGDMPSVAARIGSPSTDASVAADHRPPISRRRAKRVWHRPFPAIRTCRGRSIPRRAAESVIFAGLSVIFARIPIKFDGKPARGGQSGGWPAGSPAASGDLPPARATRARGAHAAARPRSASCDRGGHDRSSFAFSVELADEGAGYAPSSVPL